MVIMLLADIAFSISGAAAVEGNELPTLHVSENGRFIVKEDGTPFFYLGDTAWGLMCEGSHTAPSLQEQQDIHMAVTKFTSSGFQEIEYPAGARG